MNVTKIATLNRHGTNVGLAERSGVDEHRFRSEAIFEQMGGAVSGGGHSL